MTVKCFVCGKENDDKLERSPLPKELLERAPNGDLAEDFKPICKECNEFRKTVDSHFITLCEDAKLWEWYRSNSKKRGEYFPPELIYNIDINTLKELYNLIREIAEAAREKAENIEAHKDLEDELNYKWRKKDE